MGAASAQWELARHLLAPGSRAVCTGRRNRGGRRSPAGPSTASTSSASVVAHGVDGDPRMATNGMKDG